MKQVQNTLSEARALDARDKLAGFRKHFLFPRGKGRKPWVYMTGNSLGLQPKEVRANIDAELRDWAALGVEGHLHARHPWLPYHENLTAQTARLVGAKPLEVVVMNTLTVNLHLMMVSFYRPTRQRYKIIIEGGAFPSDQYAVASQARFHGFAPEDAIVTLTPRDGEHTLRTADIVATIDKHRQSLALVMLGGVNYLTGQAFDMATITKAGHAAGARVGFDLAHAAGNLQLQLHDWGPDFAVWCSYKYLNAGPGALSGCFVHERHANAQDLPRFAGWWGHDKASRFHMGPDFQAIPGAEGWQLSNPPIFQLAALRASMDLFDKVGMARLRKKSVQLTAYLESCLATLPKGVCEIITPRDPDQRGAQLSLRVGGDAKQRASHLLEHGIVCDFREPDVLRVAPVPLYNSFADVHRVVKALGGTHG